MIKQYLKKIILGISCASLLLLQSCLDTTVPTQYSSQEDIESSAKSVEALLWGMPAYSNSILLTSTGAHYQIGYGGMMRIRDVMTEEFAVVSSNYDHFSAWKNNTSQGPDWMITQYIWWFHYKFIQTSNLLINALIHKTEPTDLEKSYLGLGHAYRAFVYLDAARMFEFLPTDVYGSVNASGNDVKNLTIPIVTEETTEEGSRNNPRVTREVMVEFILSDLDAAEELLQNYKPESKVFPDLSVVYGLKARLYMWIENYPKAKEYARKAIDLGLHKPTTSAEWLNPSSGFNTITTPSWMFGAMSTKDDLEEEIINFTSWFSNEAEYGYAIAGPQSMIDKRTYDKISDDDFRKLSWVAPKDSPLYEDLQFALPENKRKLLVDYASLKFRPGSGNTTEYTTGSATAYPMMRIEEMYFIEAEAAEHVSPGQGKTLLENFMQEYRYSTYTFPASSNIIDEIIFQKRIEFWGEGLSFFDYKRLNLPVNRGYSGTNHAEMARLNTTSRPAWMNICIVSSEASNNTALIGFENPDPSDKYIPWIEK